MSKQSQLLGVWESLDAAVGLEISTEVKSAELTQPGSEGLAV